MAVVTVATGLDQVLGLPYTHITDDSNDWGNVPADKYFYDKATKLVYYNNASGTVVKVFEEGGGGDSIYTADGTVGSSRELTLTDNVTFKGNNTSLGTRNLIIKDSNGDYILENFNNGYFRRLVRSGSNYGVIANAAQTAGLWIQSTSEIAGAGGLLIKNAKADVNYLKYFTDNFKAPDAQWYSNGAIHHRIRSNGTSSTVLSQVSFFINGFYGFGFNVGASAPIGTEDISLQGHTIVKGEGTTTGTTLALYDNDTTPSKTWEWLDNGNVNIGQDSVFNLNTHKLEFKDSTGANSLLILDDNTGSTISSTNAGSFMQYAGSSTTGKLLVTSSAVTVNAGFFQSKNQAGTHIALDINNNSTNGKISINNSVGTQMEWSSDKVGITSTATQIVRNSIIKAYFADNFTILGSDNITTISGENISLQGTVLINDTLDMNNNRILNAVVNPSVQEATNSATFTINADEQSDGVLTAMSASTTIAAPTGTPVQSQDLVFRFKDDGTARSLTWNAIFRAIGVTLPTTTVASKLTYVGCKYNSTDTKWDVVAVQQEA